MELNVGDLVLILPPEDFGLDRLNRASYGPYWNDVQVTKSTSWMSNSVNMDFYVGKIGVVNELSYYEYTATAHVSLHAVYGQKGRGWTFNRLHLKKLDDENNI